MSSNPLDQLEQQLERSIENVRQIRIIVSDFQPQGQPNLNQVGAIFFFQTAHVNALAQSSRLTAVYRAKNFNQVVSVKGASFSNKSWCTHLI